MNNRIDPETYQASSRTYHELLIFESIFNKINSVPSDYDMYFEYDNNLNVYSTFLLVKKNDQIFELPFLTQKNRVYYVENIIIPERLMTKGENAVYIMNEILKTMEDKITLKKTIELLKVIDSDDDNKTS